MSQTAIPALTAYLSRLLSMPEVRDTVNFDHIKQGYALNPSGIVPLGPLGEVDGFRSSRL